MRHELRLGLSYLPVCGAWVGAGVRVRAPAVGAGAGADARAHIAVECGGAYSSQRGARTVVSTLLLLLAVVGCCCSLNLCDV